MKIHKSIMMLAFSQPFKLPAGTILLQMYHNKLYGLPVEKSINKLGVIVAKENNKLLIRSEYNLYLSIKKGDYKVRYEIIKFDPNSSSDKLYYYYIYSSEDNAIYKTDVGSIDEEIEKIDLFKISSTKKVPINKAIIGAENIKNDLN